MPEVEIDGYVNDPQRYVAEQLQREAEELTIRVARFGLVLTIEQVSQQPPRMGYYAPVVSVRPDIWSVRRAYEKAAGAPVAMLTESPDCAGISRPLSEKTQARIAAGIEKFCAKADAA